MPKVQISCRLPGLFAVALLLFSPLSAQSFAERFALSDNRSELLKELVPGSPEHFYWSVLERQHAGDLAAAEELLKGYAERYNSDSDPHRELRLRQDLLSKASTPEATRQALVRRLGLSFQVAGPSLEADAELKTSLDQTQLEDSAWLARAQARDSLLRRIGRPGLYALAANPPQGVNARMLLTAVQELSAFDLPNLSALIVRALREGPESSFRSLRFHNSLPRLVLDECAQQMPELLNDEDWVNARLARCGPSSDGGTLEESREERAQRLEEMLDLSERLSSAFNSLKAQVLLQCLEVDRNVGRYNRERFEAYLRLPHRSDWAETRRLGQGQKDSDYVSLSKTFPLNFKGQPDEMELIRDYLAHFLVDAKDFAAWTPYVRTDWLRKLFAEVKLLAGVGDAAQYTAMLGSTEDFEALRGRTELRFPRSVPTSFAREEAVRLFLDTKNIERLRVRIFRIDAAEWFRQTGKPLHAWIDLAGLVPHHERVLTLEEPPLLRVRRTFEFPECSAPGAYAIEFIGDGLSSRAVFQKGTLRHVIRKGAVGQVFQVFDEGGQALLGASLIIGAQTFEADAFGEIVLPFAGRTTRRQAVLTQGAVAKEIAFDHLSESYSLWVGAVTPRTAMIEGKRCQFLVRTELSANGNRIDLSLLEEATLDAVMTTREGERVTRRIADFAPQNDREALVTVDLPDELKSLSFVVGGHVKSLGTREPIRVAATSVPFLLNQSREVLATTQPELERTASGYRLAVRGLNGESIPRTRVDLSLWHWDWIDPHRVTLRTDDFGFIDLGPLRGIRAIEWNDSGHEFQLGTEEAALPTELRALAGEPIRIPGFRKLERLGYGVASLYSLRANTIHDSHSEQITLVDGTLQIEGLKPGHYRLELHRERKSIALHVLGGKAEGSLCLGTNSTDRLSRRLPLGFEALEWVQGASGDGLRITLRHATKSTRVHILGHALGAWDGPMMALSPGEGSAEESFAFEAPMAHYAVERQLSDEERYILERRSLRKFAGNMLERPSVLLNPWSDEAAVISGNLRAAGGGGKDSQGGRRGGLARKESSEDQRRRGSYTQWNTLTSLKDQTVVLANLIPDAEGRIFVSRPALGLARVLEIQAVDRNQLIVETIFHADVSPVRRDLRLRESLPKTEALVEAKVLKVIAAGEEWVADGSEEAQFRVFKDLASVFRHYLSTENGRGLQEFEVLMRWPKLSDEERLNAYSRLACHEVNLFLKRKDPAFFQRIIEPWLRQKVGKTFLDEYLLDENLAPWLLPDRFARLNLLERILLLKREPSRRRLAARQVRDLRAFHRINAAEEDERAVALALRVEAAGSLALAAGQSGIGIFSGPDVTLRPGSPSEFAKALDEVTALQSPERADLNFQGNDAVGFGGGGNLATKRLEVDSGVEAEEVEERDLLRRRWGRVETVISDRLEGPTLRYVERNYFGLSMEAASPSLLQANGFWWDFAQHDGRGQFTSPRFPLAAAHLNEMLLAVAVLDLPFEAEDPKPRDSENGVGLTANSPLILLGTELQKVPMLEPKGIGLVLQTQIFPVGETPKETGAPPELLVARAYMLRLSLLNPTEKEVSLRVLSQIPVGAMALDGGRPTRPQRMQLAAGGRLSLEIPFVFPREGEFTSVAAHVALANGSVQVPPPMTLKVVRRATSYDEKNWESVAAFGTLDEVLSLLEEAPLPQIDFGRILWRMTEEDSYSRVLSALESQAFFVKELWAYSLLHGDWPRIAAYLATEPRMMQWLGQTFESDWWSANPYERGVMEHVTFKPHVNTRTHPFGEEHALSIEAAKKEWDSFIQYLCRRPHPSAPDLFAVAAWLILQERLEEALEVFARIDKQRLSADLQYDAMDSWLAMSRLDLARARQIAGRHKDHPIAFWRERFAQILGHLDEAETEVTPSGDPKDREGRQSLLASQEPTLDFEIQGEELVIQHRNLSECSLRLFSVDTELQFSNNPFATDGDAPLPYIAPNHLETIALPSDGTPKTISLPAAFRAANAIIALEAKGVSRRKPRYANGLKVEVIERFGRLRVGRALDGRPLPKVYVKVYADYGGGRIEFYKDGYTDLRGAFDYLAVTHSWVRAPNRLAILVASEDLGFEVRQVRAPVD